MSDDRFVDLQVNGYVGVDFNCGQVTPRQLHDVCLALRRDGVERILATVVTNAPQRMCAALRNLAGLREKDELARELIAGFHVEGPFISPLDGFRGAHPLEHVRPADLDQAQRLLDAAGGLVRVLSLAPEQDDGLRVTRRLSEHGLVVSMAHTDAPLELLEEAIQAGARMFTHLGNGCPLHLHRHDNIIQRVLSLAERLTITFIGDLVHVPEPALGNYIRLVPPQNLVVVTDCSSPAGGPRGRYRFAGWEAEVDESGAMWSPDHAHLLGSAATMRTCQQNLRRLGLSEGLIRQALCDNPARLILRGAASHP